MGGTFASKSPSSKFMSHEPSGWATATSPRYHLASADPTFWALNLASHASPAFHELAVVAVSVTMGALDERACRRYFGGTFFSKSPSSNTTSHEPSGWAALTSP